MGCDCYVSSHSLCLGNFNPRTRMGCDISYRLFIINTFLFQSTHPHGVRHQICNCDRQFLGFQSTHPHGVRQYRGNQKRQKSPDFNPRTRMGCDWRSDRPVFHISEFQSTHPHGVRPTGPKPRDQYTDISIHAPAWGATSLDSIVKAIKTISIHAPAWGATNMEWDDLSPEDISIHAPAWGATATEGGFIHQSLLFQSTHPHGVRHKDQVRLRQLRNFNPRTRMGCD